MHRSLGLPVHVQVAAVLATISLLQQIGEVKQDVSFWWQQYLILETSVFISYPLLILYHSTFLMNFMFSNSNEEEV